MGSENQFVLPGKSREMSRYHFQFFLLQFKLDIRRALAVGLVWTLAIENKRKKVWTSMSAAKCNVFCRPVAKKVKRRQMV